MVALLQGGKSMKAALALSSALIATIGLWSISPAVAQNQPAGSVKIKRGVYTTPEISAKCQQFAIQRVGTSGYTDNSRQAVAAACVRKLMAKQSKS
jgi:hypothetical protein